jgi:hypothetical protein
MLNNYILTMNGKHKILLQCLKADKIDLDDFDCTAIYTVLADQLVEQETNLYRLCWLALLYSLLRVGKQKGMLTGNRCPKNQTDKNILRELLELFTRVHFIKDILLNDNISKQSELLALIDLSWDPMVVQSENDAEKQLKYIAEYLNTNIKLVNDTEIYTLYKESRDSSIILYNNMGKYQMVITSGDSKNALPYLHKKENISSYPSQYYNILKSDFSVIPSIPLKPSLNSGSLSYENCSEHNQLRNAYCTTCKDFVCGMCYHSHNVILPGNIKRWIKSSQSKQLNNIEQKKKNLKAAYDQYRQAIVNSYVKTKEELVNIKTKLSKVNKVSLEPQIISELAHVETPKINDEIKKKRKHVKSAKNLSI